MNGGCNGRDGLRVAGILCRESADGRPVKTLAALREDPQKAVMQQTAERT